MGEYVMRKSDATSKIPTQSVPGGTWTLLEVEGQTLITPTGSSAFGAIWGVYLNIVSTDATKLNLRWVRDPKGRYDFTGEREIALTKKGTTLYSDVWMFQAIKGQPVGIEMKHNGSKPIVIKTRESKLAYEVSK
jgi:hypothetical protein